MFQQPCNPLRVLLVLGVMLTVGLCASADTVFESFEDGLPEGLSASGASMKVVRGEDGKALRVKIEEGGRGIRLEPESGTWNWGELGGLVMDVTNESRGPVEVYAAVESLDPDGRRLKGRISRTIGPKETLPLHLFFTNAGTGPFEGLRAIPIYGVMSVHGAAMPRFRIDPERVTAIEVYLLSPEKATKLVIDDLRLFDVGSPEERIVPFPWVDKFGQLKHREFPGKASSVEDLHRQREEEARALAETPRLPGRDAYGGWADGPQLDGTGWFRTEKVDGKWWFVTPNGHLFLSFGVCCVHHGDATRIEGFEHWFDELPERGRFYLTNLKRKYGEDFAEEWRETTYNRFRSWGLNTIANWSQGDVLADSPLPYTANIGVHGHLPRIEGSTGFWSKLAEIYDPDFEAIADEKIAAVARDHKDNPLCIGYFVDNEMAWDSVRDGVLASPPEQPSRIVFIKKLKEKYPDIAALNTAWGSDAKDWDSLRVPARPTKKCLADLDELAYMFARRYFDVINAALEKHAPNQLYLGVRFMQTAPRPVMRACADVADVVSVNRYNTAINPEEWEGENALGKPVLVSEFHIGAPDRFMMHPGLVAAETQEERAEMLKQYLYSTIDSPVFVGCHWFQYMDQPVTGRHFDLEPFNTGLVSGTDLPYPEMIDALQDVLSNAYERRAEE